MSDPTRPCLGAKGKKEALRKKAAMKCAVDMQRTIESLNRYMAACMDCEDGSRVRGIDDSRKSLVELMSEYACWLESAYGGK